MEQTCIVCLGDLRTSLDEQIASEPSPAPTNDGVPTDDISSAGQATKSKLRNTKLSSKRAELDEEIVAHLLPCKHDLHNECLKPWVERANSCPICRATFNSVELSKVVGGEVIDTYAVQDKTQEAEIDPAMIVEDELFAADVWEPCLVCGTADDVHEVMFCDGCDKAVHVFCAGLDDAPEVWYCESCLADMENDIGLPGLGNVTRRQRQGTRSQPARRSQRSDRVWNRIWQEVSRRLDMDLDFPFADEEVDTRTDEQRRELANWQQRLEIASRQGVASRLRGIAQAHLHPRERIHQPEPESQEELRAWNAFDKARDLQDAPAAVRRKRKRTASPTEAEEPEDNEPRQQKRPRMRRPQVQPPNAPESSTAASHRAGEGSTFLSNLLREVETKPVSATSPDASDAPNGHHSPGPSSPAGSPLASGQSTPRAASVTPPPQRPISPPLSSTILPYSPTGQSPTFSPFSPAEREESLTKRIYHRGRRREHHSDDDDAPVNERASSTSPTRRLSYSAKEEIQRMVKLALGPRYRDKEISKDQYTDINRDVSRRLYELVGDATALADEEQREKWQRVAEAEVKRSISVLHFGTGNTNDMTST